MNYDSIGESGAGSRQKQSGSRTLDSGLSPDRLRFRVKPGMTTESKGRSFFFFVFYFLRARAQLVVL